MVSVDRRTTAFATILTIVLTLTAADPTTSFYDVLQSNGLPMGLFPKGISGFSLDPTSGLFQLNMLYPSPCDAKFETPVRYQCNITGRLDYGRISDLSGVSAQELFLWLPVKSIRVDIPSSGLIYFDVGVVFKQFSLSFFETPKDCNALVEDGGKDDVVVFYESSGAARAVENLLGKFETEQFKDDEGGRAVS